ncbi:MAG: sugar ABC transporter ATP-binding protein [Thermoprotei archaeon]|nr:MAG: sugar ABC transporter ATP-binding protein [Thermoprotei archaeon]
MVEVRMENLVKRFGKVVAVDHVNLTIKNGEFVVLLGPSGCGKTTTLRLISGLELPDEGKIYFDNRDVTYLPPKERNISMVFQSYAVWPHMTVYDNIAFPMKIKKIDEKEIDRRVKWAAELLQIKELLNRYPHQLSGGQKQRVAVARAIVIEPSVLLMDEPLSNLDALLRMLMRSELKKLQKQLKVTTIYVTHDQVEAMVMADRVAVMNRGRIMQVGTTDEIYNKPANLFVAGFIGSPRMNFFEASVSDSTLETSSFKLTLPEEFKRVLEKQETVIVGIRPEDIYPVERGIPPGVKTIELEGKVDFIEPLGSDTIIHLKIGEILLLIKVPGSFLVEYGRKLKIALDLNKLHIFDKKTEKALI